MRGLLSGYRGTGEIRDLSPVRVNAHGVFLLESGRFSTYNKERSKNTGILTGAARMQPLFVNGKIRSRNTRLFLMREDFGWKISDICLKEWENA